MQCYLYNFSLIAPIPDSIDINNFKEMNDGVLLAIDTSGGYQWPWAWYLRNFEVNYFDSTKKEILKDIDFYKYDFIIVNSGNFIA